MEYKKMKGLQEQILEYAGRKQSFTLQEVVAELSSEVQSAEGVRTALKRMVKAGKLCRMERGVYTKAKGNGTFHAVPTEMEFHVAAWMKTMYPLLDFCVYNGRVFEPFQHHLSYNVMTYLEVDAYSTQTVFDRLRSDNEFGVPIYLCPDSEFMYNYIDSKKPAIVVKKLVSQAPVEKVEGIPMPTMEKLMIDIRVDQELSYLSGYESLRMMANAQSLYVMNMSRLKRYAQRRHVQLSEEILEQRIELD